MELWLRWSWLFVVFAYGSGFHSPSMVRPRRQSDTWWRSHQSAWGSSRGLSLPASRMGSSRGAPWSQSVSGFGSSRVAQSRQLLQPPSSPISVQCAEDRMVVTVMRDFYGNGKLVKPSDLTLGSCQPTTVQATDVMFQNGLQECGSNVEMTSDWLIYHINLHYNPMSSSNVPIIRSNPAVVPVHCYYPRHGNVSSNAVKPTWLPYSSTVTSEERLGFSLRLMTADWSSPSSSPVYQLGDQFYIEASVDIQNHDPMMVFVDSCVATITPDVTSNPRYEIISNNGCLVDGMLEDSSSVFVSPRPQSNVLRFMVDAFRFTDSTVSLIYITCSLRAATINQIPDPMNKACSYSRDANGWSPIEGPSGICQCCSTGNCATAASRRMTWGSSRSGQRGFGKRHVESPIEKHGLASLGPLIVTGDHSNQISEAGSAQAARMTAGQEPLQLWVLVVIGSGLAVIVAVTLSIVGKCLLRKTFLKESVQK